MGMFIAVYANMHAEIDKYLTKAVPSWMKVVKVMDVAMNEESGISTRPLSLQPATIEPYLSEHYENLVAMFMRGGSMSLFMRGGSMSLFM